MTSQHTVLLGSQPFWGASADMDSDKSSYRAGSVDREGGVIDRIVLFGDILAI